MLLLTLRGTPTLYYGDEIGMRQVAIAPEQVRDPFEKNVPGIGVGRDGCRTPMQWDATATRASRRPSRGCRWPTIMRRERRQLEADAARSSASTGMIRCEEIAALVRATTRRRRKGDILLYRTVARRGRGGAQSRRRAVSVASIRSVGRAESCCRLPRPGGGRCTRSTLRAMKA
jgi:glycosidase